MTQGERPNTWNIRLWGRKVVAQLPNAMMMWLEIPDSLHQELSANRQKGLTLITEGQEAAHFFLAEEIPADNFHVTYEARFIWTLESARNFSLMFGQTDLATWKVQDNGEIALVWTKER
jgi:hypothetical protein